MFANFNAAEALGQRPALRDFWIERLLVESQSDSRIRTVGTVGSIASGEADVWSDIDLIISCDPRLIRERRSLARAIGSVLLEWDAPQNAPPDSMHYCTVFDLGPLPFGVDWHLWPSRRPLPSDSRILYERAPSARSDRSFEELQEKAAAQRRGQSEPEMDAEQRLEFRLAMLDPICKDLARGWPQSSAVMLRWLGFDPPEPAVEAWLGHLRKVFGSLSEGFPKSIRGKYENLLLATEWALRQDHGNQGNWLRS